MYQLYYSPGACSLAIHVLLNELGVPFELKKIDLMAGEGQSPAFLKINPRGQVPTLVVDDRVIREGAAIILYLTEEHNSTLMPRSGLARATALEWLMFGNATMHPAYGKLFWIMRAATDKSQQEALFNNGMDKIDQLWADVDAHLAKNRYLCGKDFTACDILLAVFANWGSNWQRQAKLGSNVKRFLREVVARPSYQKALKAEQVEYKAAA